MTNKSGEGVGRQWADTHLEEGGCLLSLTPPPHLLSLSHLHPYLSLSPPPPPLTLSLQQHVNHANCPLPFLPTPPYHHHPILIPWVVETWTVGQDRTEQFAPTCHFGWDSPPCEKGRLGKTVAVITIYLHKNFGFGVLLGDSTRFTCLEEATSSISIFPTPLLFAQE